MTNYIININKLYLFFISKKYNYDDIYNNFYKYLINYIISILNIQNKNNNLLLIEITNQLKSKISFNTIFFKINKIPYYSVKSNINIKYMLCNIDKDPIYINFISDNNSINVLNKSNNNFNNKISKILYNNISELITKKDYSLPTTNWLVIFHDDKYNIIFNSKNYTNITIKISIYISNTSNYYIGLYNFIDNKIQIYNKFEFNKSKIQVCIFNLQLQKNVDYKFKLIHKILNNNQNFEIRAPLSILITNTINTHSSIDNRYVNKIVDDINTLNKIKNKSKKNLK